jgi:hypothetical protein
MHKKITYFTREVINIYKPSVKHKKITHNQLILYDKQGNRNLHILLINESSL